MKRYLAILLCIAAAATSGIAIKESLFPDTVSDSNTAVKAVISEDVTEMPEPKYGITLTDEEIDLVALVTMAEAEGESGRGQRLVIDTILNRMKSDSFPNTVKGVIYQKNQFESMWNGRVDRCYVRKDIRRLVKEECRYRGNEDVMFFCANGFGACGTPMFQEGNHYFSSM